MTDSIDRREMLTRLAVGLSVTRLPDHPITRLAQQDDFERILRLASVPSLSVAVVEGDNVTTKSAGVRRAGETTTPAAPDTVYAAASLTKAVFSYMLLGLVNEGALSLDRPVGEYLAVPNPDDARGRTITARHLLSHSGGWRNWRNNTSQALTADFEPGSRWSYSGEGFFFLQRIAEKLTGKGMSQLARERVFAGMARSTGGPRRRSRTRPRATDVGARSALRATDTIELRRLMAAQLLDHALTDDRTGDPERRAHPARAPQLLSPNAAASMLRPRTSAPSSGTW
jgi:CubicO group peptidase (beta-lactamase class C family)